MTNEFKRVVVTSAAVVSVTWALVLSGKPSQTQAPLQWGVINNANAGETFFGKNTIGHDPNLDMRFNLHKEYPWRNY